MRVVRFGVLWAVVCTMLACGALSVLNSAKGSCDYYDTTASAFRANQCQDTISNPSFVATEQSTCSMTQGKWSTTLCDHKLMVAGCDQKTPEGSEFTTWYRADPDGGYPDGVINTPDDVKKACESQRTMILP